ncbi:MAG: hypothetical protein JXA68_06060 [Ignavibacteriales bacterium]|nr:hypothetical protein [Ignavibacteriales bacterium]
MKLFYSFFILIILIIIISCNEEPKRQITENEFKEHIYSIFSEYDSNDINVVRYMINEEKHYLVYPEYVFDKPMRLDIYKISEEIVLLNSISFNSFECNKLLSISLRNLMGDENMELLVEPWHDSSQSYSRVDLLIYTNPLTKDIKKVFELTVSEFSSGINENAELESDIVHDLGIEYKIIAGTFSIVASGTYNRIANQEIVYSWSEYEEMFIKIN